MNAHGNNLNREKENYYEERYFNALAKAIGIKLIILIIFLAAIGILLIFLGFEKANESIKYYLLQEVGKGIFITALISGAIKWYMARQFIAYGHERKKVYERELSNLLSKISIDVKEQTSKIAAYSSSLEALQSVGATRFYRDREEASPDILKTMEQSTIDNVKIIGISLNDYLRDENKEFHAVWSLIEEYIRSKEKQQSVVKQLCIKVLIIDPDSHGANLRSYAEAIKDGGSRLKTDVIESMKSFSKLEDNVSEKVTFEARIYNSSPILYLFWTSTTSFVQQYYFRPSHGVEVKIPVIRYQSADFQKCLSVHNELEFHFDTIWQKASVSVKEYLDHYYRGTYSGIRSANIKQISYESDINKKRFIHHISRTNKILWIKGVTLKSFFQYGVLSDEISKACSRGVKVRVLLLDPNCEQARYRSFREYQMANPVKKDINQFQDKDRLKQRLHKDSMASIDYIKNNYLNDDIVNFEAKMFQSAPEAFMLLTDDVVMVEQYHYGKVRAIESEKERSQILGGNIPVLEYVKLENKNSEVKDPYRIFRDNLKYVYDVCAQEL